MCIRAFTRLVLLGIAAIGVGLLPTRASADPIEVSGSLVGSARFALVDQELRLTFPDFAITLDPQIQLTPRFPLSSSNGSEVSLTRTLGPFSVHSFAGGTIDADVSGILSFVGPTGILNVPPFLHTAIVTGPVQVSGLLRITELDHVLFDGTLIGNGTGMVGYEDRFGRSDLQLAGYVFQFNALAATPEPASLLLVATGIAFLVRKRRHLQ